MNGQPLHMMARSSNPDESPNDQYLWDFELWHEKLLAPPAIMGKEGLVKEQEPGPVPDFPVKDIKENVKVEEKMSVCLYILDSSESYSLIIIH
mmetsp:Transcript_38406/g.63253  ORF Transcript_38406/g.63253 Transcript_38406/m.63253 type:complete len:93 (-) Transcript_38406:514-792(-)